jgi:hypothetical protein
MINFAIVTKIAMLITINAEPQNLQRFEMASIYKFQGKKKGNKPTA